MKITQGSTIKSNFPLTQWLANKKSTGNIEELGRFYDYTSGRHRIYSYFAKCVDSVCEIPDNGTITVYPQTKYNGKTEIITLQNRTKQNRKIIQDVPYGGVIKIIGGRIIEDNANTWYQDVDDSSRYICREFGGCKYEVVLTPGQTQYAEISS